MNQPLDRHGKPITRFTTINDLPETMSNADIAAAVGWSEQKVRSLIRGGSIIALRNMNGTLSKPYRVPKECFKTWREGQKVQPKTETDLIRDKVAQLRK